MPDPIAAALEELNRDPGDDPLRAVDDLLRDTPALSGRLIDKLLPLLARPEDKASAARLALAVGAAHLAARDARRAQRLLVEGLGLLEAGSRELARGSLHLAAAELALGNVAAARGGLTRALPAILDLDDEALLGELATSLRATGDANAAAVVDRLRGERRAERRAPRTGERLSVVARLTQALNSGAAGTAEPLYAIVRAILAETGAERGFVMLYDDAVLRFELGLRSDGRALAASDFELSTTVVDEALASARCVLVPDLAASLPYAQASSARELGLRSALCAPLRVERRRPGARPGVGLPSVRGIAGVLYVDATTAGSFGEGDARFFEILADCAVLALRTVRTAAALAAQPVAPAARRRASPTEPGVGDPELARHYPELVTRDPGMLDFLGVLERVAPTDSNVLIRGESGTGKELVARALHRRGPRPEGPFVALDCGAIPDELAPAELFGHEAGAFTGAVAAHPGLFERADGGTLFLDEVGEMSPVLQAALLRALQEGEVRRLGDDRVRKVSVRLVSATSRDLRALVERGELRQDLLFRIAVVQLRLPPLRDRQGDIPLLVENALERIASGGGRRLACEPAALERLEEHGWPGNVRELENVLRAASVIAGSVLTLAEIDEVLADAPAMVTAAPSAPARPAPEETLEDAERRTIVAHLDACKWNLAQAARSLGIDRGTLRRKLRRFGITGP